MYHNWDDEHKDEAIIPDVYENLYLNKTILNHTILLFSRIW
jgi:hypothetical protein